MRYQFVDCRWELGNPGRGPRALPRRPHPGRELPRRRHRPLGSAGRARPPSAAGRRRLRGAAGRAGIGAGVFVVAYGVMGGAERLWWLLRHFGHDDCAVIDFDAWHGPLTRGDEAIEPATFTPAVRRRRHRRSGGARAAPRRPRRGRRARAGALARRAESDRQGPGPDPRRAQRAVERAAAGAAAPASSSPTAARASPRRAVLHRLHLAGRDGKLYPGSWSEWEQRGLPVERDC